MAPQAEMAQVGKKIQREITHDLFKFQMIPADHPTITELLSRIQMERNRSLVGEMNGEATPPPPPPDH